MFGKEEEEETKNGHKMGGQRIATASRPKRRSHVRSTQAVGNPLQKFKFGTNFNNNTPGCYQMHEFDFLYLWCQKNIIL